MEQKALKILWFANTPGLSTQRFQAGSTAGGWIAALQTEVEKMPSCELAFAFYSDKPELSFEFNNTKYFPIQRIAHTRNKRLLQRVMSKTESAENLPRFLQVINEFKPDIIHVHGTENAFGLILREQLNIPVVVSIQGNLTVYAKKYFSGVSMPWLFNRLLAGVPFLKMDYRQFVKRSATEREMLERCHYVFGRTDWDRRICRVLAPRARYYTQQEVMRPAFYAATWSADPERKPVFHTTSSNSLYKGFETIVDTALLLMKLQFNFEWTVAGLQEQDPLVRLIKKERGVASLADIRVHTLGQLAEKELVAHMLNTSVYVQVSHVENSPNSVCEAMLLGLPVVASYAGGTSSLVTDKETGLLVQDGDPYALAGALIELAGDTKQCQTLSKNARVSAQDRHHAPAVAAQLLGNYRAVLQNHQAC